MFNPGALAVPGMTRTSDQRFRRPTADVPSRSGNALALKSYRRPTTSSPRFRKERQDNGSHGATRDQQSCLNYAHCDPRATTTPLRCMP